MKNIGAGGLRGLQENGVPWITFIWCLAHCLQLALIDSLKTTYFSTEDEMLLHLYEKSKSVLNWSISRASTASFRYSPVHGLCSLQLLPRGVAGL